MTIICKQIQMTAKSSKGEALEQLLVGLLEPSRNEQGCLKYELYQRTEQPLQFVIIETWASAATLDAHKLTAHFLAFKSALPELVAEKSSLSLKPLES